MVSFVQLTWFKEALKNEEHRAKLWVLLKKLLDELDAVDAILSIKTNIDIYRSQFILQLNNRYLCVFNWLDWGTNISSHELRGNSVYHSKLFDGGVVDEQIDIGLGQVNTSRAGAENENFSLWVDFLDDRLDTIDNLLAMSLFSFALRDKLDEVKNLTMHEQENVLDLQCALAQPRVLVLVKSLSNFCLQLTTLIVVFWHRVLLRCCCPICSHESIFWDLVEAQEIVIQLVSHLVSLFLLFSKS